MINNATKPEQILVIDDNHSWLETLRAKGIQVLCCKTISIGVIENHVAEKEMALEVVVINANLLQGSGTQRSDLRGLEVGFKVLAPQFQKIIFIPLSFSFSSILHHTTFCYTQFLTDLIEITNDRGKSNT